MQDFEVFTRQCTGFSGCIDIFEGNFDRLYKSILAHSKVGMHFSYGNDVSIPSFVIQILPITRTIVSAASAHP